MRDVRRTSARSGAGNRGAARPVAVARIGVLVGLMALVGLPPQAGLSPMAIAGATGSASNAPAAGPPTTRTPASAEATESPAVPSGTPNIIPEPNSGQRPTRAGDRGGAMQLGLFLAICGAVLLVGLLAYLDGQRNKRRVGRLRPLDRTTPAAVEPSPGGSPGAQAPGDTGPRSP